MKGKLFYTFVFLFFSCKSPQREIHSREIFPKVVDSGGHQIPKDSLLLPKEIPAGTPLKTHVGKPRVVYTDNNIHTSGTPKIILAGNPEVITPGQDTFLLPEKKEAIIRPFTAELPEIVNVRDVSLRDPNPYNFSSLSKLQGLNHNQVTCLLQDRNGNLWIGTLGGVSRYDGKSFTNFTEKSGLSNNKVYSILEDKSGNLWFGTNGGGVTKYDGKFFTHFTENEGLSNNRVYSILQDTTGNIWFGTDGGGVSEFDGKYFTKFSKKEGLSNKCIYSIFQDKRDNLWFGTNGEGVIKFDGKSFSHFTEKEGLSNNHVCSILQDEDGKIWFGMYGGGVSAYDGKSFTHFTVKEGLSNNLVKSMFKDKNKNLWFGTDGGGVSKYDGKSFTHFTEKEGFSNNTVNCIFQGKYGILWFGTDGGGLSKYDGELFTHFTEKDGLNDNRVNSILEDSKGYLWFGTERHGVSRYDGRSFSNYSENEGLGNNCVYCILQDKTGNIWFGTDGGGVDKFDGIFFTHFTEKEGLIGNRVMSILQDKVGNMWFGTTAGVSKFNGLSFTNFTTKEGLINNRVFSIFQDSKDNIWFGTEGGGVSKYDGNSFTQFSKKDGLTNNYVYGIVQDKSGNLWFITNGGGVSEYNGKTFTKFTEKEGLMSDYVYSVLLDKKDNIWFGTRFGLSKLSSYNLTRYYNINKAIKDGISDGTNESQPVLFENFTYEDGFLGIGCNREAMLEVTDGTIWIGANENLTVYHPEGERPDSIPPNIQLTGIGLFNNNFNWEYFINNPDTNLIMGNGVRVSDIHFRGITKWYGLPVNLSLGYKNNFITFNFIGITQKHNKKIKYQYKLEGLDENWSVFSTRNEASYGNLSHGNYTFKVKAMNSEGYLSKEYSYPFVIRPPWWKTFIFRIFAIAFVLMILYSIYKLRITSLKNQKRQLEIIVREKTNEVTEQKEELQTTNEELIQNVEELNKQREELEATLYSLKETQEKLFQSEKMASIGILASGVAHEINNPLNFINGGIQGIESYFNDNLKEHTENVTPLIDAVNIGLTRATEIVKSLNSFNRQTESITENCDIHTIINNCLIMLINQTRNRIEIQKHFTQDVFTLFGNEGKLHQALMNILTNAVQAIEGKGIITISTCLVDSSIIVIVNDTGHGIDNKFLNKIFDPFFTTREQGIGKGLGLSISFQIIMELNGTLDIRSEIGKGTTVTISLPIIR